MAFVLKRLFDICSSFALLLLFLPVLVIAACLIKLTSSGPVFFLQERIGTNKRRFRIWKFADHGGRCESLMPQLEAKNEVSVRCSRSKTIRELLESGNDASQQH